MQVSKNDTICGLAAYPARQLMRAYYDERPVEVACDILGIGKDAARDQMRAFEAAGYTERTKEARTAGEDWWATTVKGNALANASFGKPISRSTATRLLAGVVERARGYNADPARLLTITEIVVFCSRGRSPAANTGTGLSGTCGGLSPAIGSGISSSAASHLKNCCKARNWLLAYAGLYRPSSQTIHSCTSCFLTSGQPVRPAVLRRRAAANHCTASM